MLFDIDQPVQPFCDNREMLDEYQILIDQIFDFVLDAETGTDDFDITAEALPDPSMDQARMQLTQMIEWIEQRENVSPDTIPLIAVMKKLAMERVEKLLFWLILMPELSGSCYRAYRRQLQLRGEAKITAGFYFDMLRYALDIRSGDFLELLSDTHHLGRYCVDRSEEMLSFSTGIHMRETIVCHCRGEQRSDHRYFSYYQNRDTVYGIRPYTDRLLRLCKEAERENRACVVRFTGDRLAGKKTLLYALAKQLNRKLMVISMDQLNKVDAKKVHCMMEEIGTECFLEQPLIYIEDPAIENKKEAQKEADGQDVVAKLVNMLCGENGMIFCFLPDACIRKLTQPYAEIAVGGDLALKKAVWQGVIDEYGNTHLESAEHLASKYPLNAGMIRKVMKQAQMYSCMENCDWIEKRHLQQAVFSSGSIDFEGLATRVPAVFGWDDIELKEPVKRTLQLVMKRINLKYRVGEKCGLNKKLAYGKGVNILFYGKPGTGKTMCAQVLAKELGMELYRVDISQLVSKYIGETEKNLAKVFDEAKKGNIILFFDEADSIFSQRTQVNGTNDKHANAEVSFLLQKMEEYPGIAILATNLMQNFDPAVMRRLTYSINFELPDKETVLKLWQTTLPGHVKIDEKIDLEYFAGNLELSGSNIKSILYNAAYMAASEDADEIVITAEELIPAIQMEYEKIGEFLNRSSLGPYMAYARE